MGARIWLHLSQSYCLKNKLNRREHHYLHETSWMESRWYFPEPLHINLLFCTVSHSPSSSDIINPSLHHHCLLKPYWRISRSSSHLSLFYFFPLYKKLEFHNIAHSSFNVPVYNDLTCSYTSFSESFFHVCFFLQGSQILVIRYFPIPTEQSDLLISRVNQEEVR